MRILFYTGNNGEVFAHNAAAAGVDLGHLDFAICFAPVKFVKQPGRS